MDGWVIDALKANGLAGAFIMVLLGAIAVLWQTIRSKDKQLATLNAERADEREKFVKLVEGANTAAMVTAKATETRNEIMEDLGKALTTQANAIERYDDRVKGQAEMFKEKLADFRHVVDAFGESNRVSSGLLSDIRAAISKFEATLNQAAITVAAHARKS